MRTEGKRRSDHFEDRGAGGGRNRWGRRGGSPLIGLLVRRLGPKGILVMGAVLVAAYLFGPASLRRALSNAVGGGSPGSAAGGSGSVCTASRRHAAACDFSRVVLASTEDVWARLFSDGALPQGGDQRAPSRYEPPTLVVFLDAVETGGCGHAEASTGPFYCPADRKLYIDPTFYDLLARQLKSPGDFAQAYVIAHEVGHHVQNLIGSSSLAVRGETREQHSVRVELQADCFAGVWGHTARADLSITDDDLDEAIQAAHSIGDDALGHRDRARFTHGSSDQRIRWFRRGFDSGDPRQCDTFAVTNRDAL